MADYLEEEVSCLGVCILPKKLTFGVSTEASAGSPPQTCDLELMTDIKEQLAPVRTCLLIIAWCAIWSILLAIPLFCNIFKAEKITV